MTEQEELAILEALKNLNSPKIHYKKIYFRLNDLSVLDKDETSEDFFRNFGMDNNREIVDEVVDCSGMTLKEWDDLEFSLEHRTPYFSIKYPI